MSFQMTERQYVERTKDVTRRLGWWNVKPGEIQNGVNKCMGFKKGERPRKLGQHVIVSARPEPLNVIPQEDVIREGFPELTPAQFVEMFVAANRHKKCGTETTVNRIEFERLPD
ncbi:MAG: hypothetical protein WCF57_20160 [Pyrinomonadaceae bacterium]